MLASLVEDIDKKTKVFRKVSGLTTEQIVSQDDDGDTYVSCFLFGFCFGGVLTAPDCYSQLLPTPRSATAGFMVRVKLRSSSSDALVVPPTRLCTVGDRAAHVWNGLPAHVTSSPSLHIFKRHLKTLLFSQSFASAASQ